MHFIGNLIHTQPALRDLFILLMRSVLVGFLEFLH